MSRCFPYPPPGYVSNRATGDGDEDALIESIKIEREKEKNKHERKEQKRREKKERKAEKKEKKRERGKLKSDQRVDGSNKRKRDTDGPEKYMDKRQVSSEELHLQKEKELEAEQLERSTISQEHGQPVLNESLSYSSDGTKSKINKIEVDQCPSNGNCSTQGTVFRFRLKGMELENAQSSDDIPSTSVGPRTNTKIFNACPVKDTSCVVAAIPAPDKHIEDAISLPMDLMAIHSSHGKSSTLPVCGSSAERDPKKPKSAYEALLSELAPHPMLFEVVASNEHEQWLLNSCKKQGRQDMRSWNADGVSGQQSPLLPPHAHILPEADLYALPFTVPF